MSIWTAHVSNSDNSSITNQTSTLMTSIFPENDNTSHFMIQEHSDDGSLCKAPLKYREGKQIPGLMTLKSLVEGGAEVLHAKVLVCIKSIGGRKTGKIDFPHIAYFTDQSIKSLPDKETRPKR